MTRTRLTWSLQFSWLMWLPSRLYGWFWYPQVQIKSESHGLVWGVPSNLHSKLREGNVVLSLNYTEVELCGWPKGAFIPCRVAECNTAQFCHMANAEKSVDFSVSQLLHSFCMLRHVAECCVAWKFDWQSVGIIKDLSLQYLPLTVA